MTAGDVNTTSFDASDITNANVQLSAMTINTNDKVIFWKHGTNVYVAVKVPNV